VGKQRDGWFGTNDLLQQVERVINILEGKVNNFAQGLFMFDNAPCHQKCALNVLSACRIPKGASMPTPSHLYLTQPTILNSTEERMDVPAWWASNALWSLA